MKATDLMIGDWVKYTLTGIPARVTGIIKTPKECNIYAYVGTGNRLQGINERDFEPIPLTEDFLLKNGFRKEEFKDHNVFIIFHLGISVEKVGTGWFINTSKVNGSLRNYFTEFSGLINYVHELRHVLFVGGIEKEVIV